MAGMSAAELRKEKIKNRGQARLNQIMGVYNESSPSNNEDIKTQEPTKEPILFEDTQTQPKPIISESLNPKIKQQRANLNNPLPKMDPVIDHFAQPFESPLNTLFEPSLNDSTNTKPSRKSISIPSLAHGSILILVISLYMYYLNSPTPHPFFYIILFYHCAMAFHANSRGIGLLWTTVNSTMKDISIVVFFIGLGIGLQSLINE